MVRNMRDNLKMVKEMDKEQIFGQVVRNMRDIIKMTRKMEKES